MKIVFDTALRDYMLQEDQKILETVIPNLAAYHAFLKMKGIFEQKIRERKKEIEKMEREGKKVTFQKEEEEKVLTEEQIMNRRIDEKMNSSNMSYLSEAQKEKERERLEIEQYGRMWIWDGYFNPNNKEKYTAAAVEVAEHQRSRASGHRRLHSAGGVQAEENIKVQTDIKKHIEGYVKEKRAHVPNKTKEQEEEEKKEDKNRHFLN
eukprot:CAMPEP_0202965012 /NCGR_PEP_ID=MMETSP1396-20130829/9133_1 /ASSEMBLY_ACC=CAM_ASM_000872 /TAXON_ID= /ORGANISM="Pseudokeronopsis sp., Strain Brazil" /LENGTH=206 /DNA_ID=CAMNT_0049687593 /DNA_START=992 /DNA_END=1612 /DNA_ORIENTATION=-